MPALRKKHRAVKKGRETKCQPLLVDAICEIIADGLSVESACVAVGISNATYWTWRRKGRAGEAPYVSFLEALQKAKVRRERAWLQDIRDAAQPDVNGKRQWQAVAWLLERTNPTDWSRPAQRVIVETTTDPETATATKEQLIAAALKAAKGERKKRD